MIVPTWSKVGMYIVHGAATVHGKVTKVIIS